MTDKIKIAFITERMILGHGVDLVIDRIASGLCDLGYECDVFCNNYDETFKKQKPYNLIKLPKITGSNVINLEKNIKKLKLLFNNRNEDVFILNTFPFYCLAQVLNKPVISINYGIVSTQGMPLKRKLFYKYMDFTQNFFYFPKSSSIVSISNFLNNKLPNYLRKKSRCIYPGTDHYAEIKIDQNQINEFRGKNGVKKDDILLLYTGRLNPVNQPYKGITELIEIFHIVNRQNNKIKLMVTGFGSLNDEIALKNEGIITIANAPWEMMPIIYSACDIYTTCTKWEGFDLPIVEAQTFGKPSICYNIGAHPEIMQDNKTGYLVNSKEEFIQKLLILAKDLSLREEMRLNCIQNSKKFTWEKSIGEYNDEIKKILNNQLEKYNKKYKDNINDYTQYKNLGNIKKINLKNKLNDFYYAAASNNLNDIYLNKKLTVLIINYNSSFSCLNECINSLLAQTYKEFNIMIFDNGSANDTIDVMSNHLKEQNINTIIFQIQKGSGQEASSNIMYTNNTPNIKNDATSTIISDNNTNNNLINNYSSTNNNTKLDEENLKDINVIIIKNKTNLGLAKAINLSVEQINSPYILISNFDVVFNKNAIEELMSMIKNYKNDEFIIGLAPKIKFEYKKDYIESVGTYIDTSLYDGYQGMGQLDLHQYDVPEDIFGVSFTSALLKKEAFNDDKVGKLDETFFLFYEDFDFCFRANIKGYKFKSCPDAVVYHKYSYSFREESSAFETKYYYKRLNLLKMMYKNADESTIKRVLPTEIKIMKQNLKDKNLKKVSKKILSDLKKSKKYLLMQREIISLSKILSDAEAIKYYWGEQNFFDVVKNEPKYEVENLIKVYQRLFAITGSNKYMEYINYLVSINNTKFKFEPEILKHKLHSKLENEPISVHEFIDML